MRSSWIAASLGCPGQLRCETRLCQLGGGLGLRQSVLDCRTGREGSASDPQFRRAGPAALTAATSAFHSRRVCSRLVDVSASVCSTEARPVAAPLFRPKIGKTRRQRGQLGGALLIRSAARRLPR